ncbi:MAG: Ig-like domain-containing protein, partial [Planctomycetota bacterium]
MKTFRARSRPVGKRGFRRRGGRPRRRALAMECLEPRMLLAGQTITVTSLFDQVLPDGKVTLREAVQAANTDSAVNEAPAGNGADTIDFDPSLFGSGLSSIFLLFGALEVTDDLTLLGPGSDKLEIDAFELSRVFVVDDGVDDGPDPEIDVTLSGLTIKAGGLGSGPGGGVYNKEHLIIRDSVVTENIASGGEGGGIYNDRGTLEIVDSTVSYNEASSSGGGVFNLAGTITVTGSTIANNKTRQAGGTGGGIASPEGGTLTIKDDSSITHNEAQAGTGGGIYSAYQSGDPAALTITDSVVSSNNFITEGIIGGGIFSVGTLTLTRSTISDNTAGAAGGVCHEGPCTVTASSISRNTGGGIHLISPSGPGHLFRFDDSTISGNLTDNDLDSAGAGIHQAGGTLEIFRSTVSGNAAFDPGNSAYQPHGAGIYSKGTLKITNSTVSANLAGGLGEGGGVYVDDETAGLWTITNSTIVGNSADAGGGLRLSSGTLTARNTIFANNSATIGPEVAGTLDGGHNLVENPTDAVLIGSDWLTGQDPMLDPLGDNGGPTLTHALQPGSPAMDSGDGGVAPATDQRGVARPQDGDGDDVAVVDLGAFEFAGPASVEGRIFEDVNRNGEYDLGDTPLAGWTVHLQPTGGSGQLTEFFHSPAAQLDDHFGHDVAALESDVLADVLVSAWQPGVDGINPGAVHLFAGSGTFLKTFERLQQEGENGFGGSIAVLGDDILVGDPWLDGGIGAAYLFDRDGTPLATFDNPTPDLLDHFGHCVAAVGDFVLIGAPYDDAAGTDGGAAYLFNRLGELQKTFLSPMPTTEDHFGGSVAAAGQNVLIGAEGADLQAPDAGAAFLFDAAGNLLRALRNPAPEADDHFGSAIAAVGEAILVGAPGDDASAANAGAAYLIDGSTGRVLHSLLSPNPNAGDQFGHAVAASGDNVLVGSPLDRSGGSQGGAAFLFDSATGVLLTSFINPTPAEADLFASSLAALGDNVLIGAPEDDDLDENAGAAYLFDATVPTTTVVSQPDGTYEMTDLEAGAFQVKIDLPEGYYLTRPTDGRFAFELGEGETAGPLDFAVALNRPPVAENDDHYEVDPNTTLAVSADGVLGNDNDPDGHTLTALLAAGPDHGTLAFWPDGSFVYEPEPGFTGVDTFTYLAHDGSVASNGAATVTITVDLVNRPPVPAEDRYEVQTGGTLTVDVFPSSQLEGVGVLRNDTDPNGDTLTATLADEPDHGSVTLFPNGSFIYTPDAGYEGEDSFTYRAGDGGLTTDPPTLVTIQVAPSVPWAADVYAVIRDPASQPPGGPQGEADSLPGGLEWVDEWGPFWVDVWGETPGVADAGIDAFSVDLVYNTDRFTATEIVYGPAFTENQQVAFDDAAGEVNNLTATSLLADAGDDKLVLLARVLFESRPGDVGVPHNAQGQYVSPVYDLGLSLAEATVSLAGRGTGDAARHDPPEIEIWPVMYDVDDSRQVGFGDLAFLATAFQQNVWDPGGEFTWATDFNGSGRVDFADLAFFAEN